LGECKTEDLEAAGSSPARGIPSGESEKMMERRFARLRRAPVETYPGSAEVPDNGMCLSVFLVLEPPNRDGAVLMGRINPSAPWAEIGALDPKRIASIGDRWMLPSCQLLLFESPSDAARRILKEQLGSSPLPLGGPLVFSDPSERAGGPGRDPHWDFHFVYRGRWGSTEPPHAPAWKHLEFVEVARTRRAEIARSQGDVLELAGLRPKD
jgi:ADP-ribose pyrophosphatase YjhB (NUDIX family)